jgi:hypothetical protein
MATVCRTNWRVNHDVDDSPEIFRGSARPFHGS